jgi:molybdopterin synthase sulfur carrier subunit
MISVSVLFFASLQEATHTDAMQLSLPDDSNLTMLMQRLEQDLSSEALAAVQAENVRIAVNQALVSSSCSLQDGDEIAFLPPVTGG